jgi:hypothetical protein
MAVPRWKAAGKAKPQTPRRPDVAKVTAALRRLLSQLADPVKL